MQINSIVKADLEKMASANLPWYKIKNKSFLITGGNGFIASYIVESLLYFNKIKTTKTKVSILVKDKRKAEQRFSSHLGDKTFKIIEHDVNEKLHLNRKFDFIIHAASNASPRSYAIDPVGTLLPNVVGTKNLLEYCVKNKVKCFMFLSSGEVYGNVTNRISELNFGSFDPLDIRSCYSESKRMGENMCISWFRQYGVPVRIARIFHVFGPRMDLSGGRIFEDFLSDIISNENITVKSKGTAKKTFTYISDTVLGLFTIMLKGKNGNAYNVVNPNNLTTIDGLAKLLLDLVPEKKLRVVFERETNSRIYARSGVKIQNPDVSKLLKLGWKPIFSLKNGGKRTILSYLEDNNRFKDIN